MQDVSMDEKYELAGMILENVKAVLLAIYGADSVTDDDLKRIMPHPELFDFTMGYMDDAGLVTWSAEDD